MSWWLVVEESSKLEDLIKAFLAEDLPSTVVHRWREITQRTAATITLKHTHRDPALLITLRHILILKENQDNVSRPSALADVVEKFILGLASKYRHLLHLLLTCFSWDVLDHWKGQIHKSNVCYNRPCLWKKYKNISDWFDYYYPSELACVHSFKKHLFLF